MELRLRFTVEGQEIPESARGDVVEALKGVINADTLTEGWDRTIDVMDALEKHGVTMERSGDMDLEVIG